MRELFANTWQVIRTELIRLYRAFLDVLEFMLIVWVWIYCGWFMIWFLTLLKGRHDFLGQDVVPFWAVDWRWHITIPLMLLGFSFSLTYIVWGYRSIRARHFSK